MQWNEYPNENTEFRSRADYQGQQAWIPAHCKLDASYRKPEVDLPVIAAVGRNEATSSVNNYFENLWSLQSGLFDGTGIEEDRPDWRIKQFADENEFYAYLQQEDYGVSEDYPGVCFGYRIEENAPADYSATFYYQDLRVNFDDNAIPSQAADPYDPLAVS
jgi:hypothetical protein